MRREYEPHVFVRAHGQHYMISLDAAGNVVPSVVNNASGINDFFIAVTPADNKSKSKKAANMRRKNNEKQQAWVTQNVDDISIAVVDFFDIRMTRSSLTAFSRRTSRRQIRAE